MAEDLASLRRRLDQLDEEILALVAQRQATVASIGQLKHQQGRHLRDFEREREVLELARQRGEQLTLPASLSQGLMRLLIEHSLSSQERGSLHRSVTGAGHHALVIGGLGRMGRWFADFLSIQSYQVTIVDPKADAVDEDQIPYQLEKDWQGLAQSVDLIVVAAPMAASAEILTALAEVDTEAIIFDVGSLKAPLLPALKALAARGAAVVSVHPMFGPDCSMLSGKHVVLIDLGHQGALSYVSQLFDNTMAEVVCLSASEHDRLMAYVLSFSHLVNIVFATVLRQSGEEALRLRHISSTSFEEQMKVARRIASENPQVYYEIQALNPQADAIRTDLITVLEQVHQMIMQRDVAGFCRLMQDNQDYLSRVSSAPSVGDEGHSK